MTEADPASADESQSGSDVDDATEPRPRWYMPPPPPIVPKVRFTLRLRLSTLWCLEWAITGAILTYLPLYFTQKGLSSEQLGLLMAVGAIGLWVAPFVVGYVCDRVMNTERYLALSHFVGGILLLAIPVVTEIYVSGRLSFVWLVASVGLYAAAYFPTIPLASSLTFRHLPDPDSQFGQIRIWGTTGWVLAGIGLSCWLGRSELYGFVVRFLPQSTPTVDNVVQYLTWLPPPDSSDCFTIASLLSFALAFFSLKQLPATPPVPRTPTTSNNPLKVFTLFRDSTFRTLIGVSFLLAIVATFYSYEAPRMLERNGVEAHWVPALMTVGQLSEFPALILLPLLLVWLGLKGTFALGIIAWMVRYAVFAFSPPLAVLLFGVALNGICHVCLVIVIQLYVDSASEPDIKASAQNLFAFVTMGLGLPLGFVAGGVLSTLTTDPETGMSDDRIFFGVPAVILSILLWIFLAKFRYQKKPQGD